MFRAWCIISRRLESISTSGPCLRSAPLQPEFGSDLLLSALRLKVSVGGSQLNYCTTTVEPPGVPTPLEGYDSACAGGSTLAATTLPSAAEGPGAVSLPGLESAPSRWPARQLPAILHGTIAAHAPAAHVLCGMNPHQGLASTQCGCTARLSTHQSRAASSSSGAAAKGKPKGKGAAGSKPATPAKSEAAAAPQRVRTAEWARMPLRTDELLDVMRRRKGRLLKIRKQLLDVAEEASRGGFSEVAKQQAAEAAAAALPIPPEDAGGAELALATAADTPFEVALEKMKDLLSHLVVLDASEHLGPLLRKALSSEQLTAALELLRRNHLVQAAVRMGAHDAAHTGLHEVMVQECKRVGSAAPLVTLWESLYEHGVAPSAAAASSAVGVAVALRDAGAAVALLALSSQYDIEPLAAEAASAVVALLEKEQAAQVDSVRKLLPRLGIRVA